MKPYASWERVTADKAYNCHCCGRLACQGDAVRAHDVFRVHEACVRYGSFSQLHTGLSEALREGKKPPEHVRCVVCGERPEHVGDLRLDTGFDRRVRLETELWCANCGAVVELVVRPKAFKPVDA